MKRMKTLLLALIMTTMTLSGCIGNSDVETSEGDDVELGESPDDWPTYYVQSSGDLPTCDSTTLGRLYYVEDDVNFQACMSTGWEVVDIGGSNSNIILNSPPVLSASIWSTDGGETTARLLDDGDGTMSITFLMDWFAYDVDGTIASVGIDHDLDGVIDVTLPGDSGALDPQSSVLLPDGNTITGVFQLPLEEGVSVTRITNFKEHEQANTVVCGLVIQKSFAVIAEDNSGAKSVFPIVAPIRFQEGYDIVDGFEIQESLYQALPITQADLDWLAGGTSSCPVAPTFSVVDHVDPLTAGGGDNIATITISGTSNWLDWNPDSDYGENWGVWPVYCINSNTGEETWIEAATTYNGVNPDVPADGDTISIIDHSNGNCDTDDTHLEITIRISSQMDVHFLIPIS